VALGRQCPELGPGQRLLRGPERLGELEQLVHEVRALPHEEVDDPRAGARLPQASDRRGQVAVARRLRRLGPRITRVREVLRQHPVQLVGDLVELVGNAVFGGHGSSVDRRLAE